MKKWFLGVVVILILALTSVYVFIPSTINIVKVADFNCTVDGAYRCLSDEGKWVQWLPFKDSATGRMNRPADPSHTFTYNDYAYQVASGSPGVVDVLIERDNFKASSRLDILPLLRDSSEITWQCTIAASLNPIKRVLQYQQAVQIKKNMNDIINGLQVFLIKPENIYKIHIEPKGVRDTNYVSIKTSFNSYPTVETIYKFIDKLRAYLITQGAKETNYPICSITKADSINFEIRVGIPIDKTVKGSGDILFKTMVPGHMFVTEVKGGFEAIHKAEIEMENYISDYHEKMVVIPYQSLVTNRSSEPDTAKWITKLCYPAIP
jgi:hypothetical protein